MIFLKKFIQRECCLLLGEKGNNAEAVKQAKATLTIRNSVAKRSSNQLQQQ